MCLIKKLIYYYYTPQSGEQGVYSLQYLRTKASSLQIRTFKLFAKLEIFRKWWCVRTNKERALRQCGQRGGVNFFVLRGRFMDSPNY